MSKNLDILVVGEYAVDVEELVDALQQSEHAADSISADEFEKAFLDSLAVYDLVMLLNLNDYPATALTGLRLLESCHLHKIPLIVIYEADDFSDISNVQLSESMLGTYLEFCFPRNTDWNDWTRVIIENAVRAYEFSKGQAEIQLQVPVITENVSS